MSKRLEICLESCKKFLSDKCKLPDDAKDAKADAETPQAECELKKAVAESLKAEAENVKGEVECAKADAENVKADVENVKPTPPPPPPPKPKNLIPLAALSFIGPKHIESAKPFISSAVYFGTAATLFGLYFCEWKALLQYMPYYGGKYAPPPPPPKDKC